LYRPRVSAPALRPLGIGEIFDVSIKVYRNHFGTLIKLVSLVVVPVGILSGLIEVSALPQDEELYAADSEALGTYIAGFVVASLLSIVAWTVATAACFKAVADAYLGQRPNWRDSLGFVLRRLHSVLWILVLSIVILIPAFLACFLPGVWLSVCYAVAIPALLTERQRGFQSLRRSYGLVRGRWWPTFAVVFLGYLLTSIVGGALGAVVGGLTTFETTEVTVTSAFANVAASIVSNVLTIPFIAAFLIVLYFDLRVRKEAFDLQLLAEQIGVEPPEGIGPPPVEPPPDASGEQPPFWPPPPGWKPSQREVE
jgi:hypothetical protein